MSKAVILRKVLSSDIKPFAQNMREADRRELKRYAGFTPEYELRKAVELSDVSFLAETEDGVPLSIFGGMRANVLERKGIVWELSTNAVNENPLTFARESKPCLDIVMRVLKDVEVFYNFVDEEYAQAIRWISWMGGKVSGDVGHTGIGGSRFLYFEIQNPHFTEAI